MKYSERNITNFEAGHNLGRKTVLKVKKKVCGTRTETPPSAWRQRGAPGVERLHGRRKCVTRFVTPGIAYRIAPCLPCSCGCSQGANTDSGATAARPAAPAAGARAQAQRRAEAERRRDRFNRFTVFPLISLVLLAQLPFLPLLRRHQRTVLRITGLQGGDQPGLLRRLSAALPPVAARTPTGATAASCSRRGRWPPATAAATRPAAVLQPVAHAG